MREAAIVKIIRSYSEVINGVFLDHIFKPARLRAARVVAMCDTTIGQVEQSDIVLPKQFLKTDEWTSGVVLETFGASETLSTVQATDCDAIASSAHDAPVI